jgi:hypothetical protein
VGLLNGRAIMKNNIVVSQNIKYRIVVLPKNSNTWIYVQEMKTVFGRNSRSSILLQYLE